MSVEWKSTAFVLFWQRTVLAVAQIYMIPSFSPFSLGIRENAGAEAVRVVDLIMFHLVLSSRQYSTSHFVCGVP